MLHVGLTGGIASGKSTVARMLVEQGALLIDLDELAHAVQAPEGEVWREIVRHFGPEILCPDGEIDRGKLGRCVFADRKKLDLLGSIVHPAVFVQWRRRLDEIREAHPEAIVLSDIPLLVEAGLKPMVDLVLLVYLPPEEQMVRLMARNGFSREEALNRLASQMPIGEKLAYADMVIGNDGSPEETRRAVAGVWEELKKRERLHRTGAGRSGAL
ncbi:MAG: dephospho-CoA kinase [Deltaproteobacteria bacterium]|nr:dephospho-CoA kinase [Deltaproteobacteria bacterium]